MAQEPTLKIGRREFTRAGVLALLSGVSITLSDCGGGSSSPTNPTPPPPSGGGSGSVSGQISGNHGHSAVVTAAQITAANSVMLDITGTASHPHRVDLSAAEVVQIGGGQRVQKLSTNNSGHDHTVTFN
jgi:hypothetical protein